ncbi:piggyBac transposable element-derived protein 4-like isoform X2 [Sinocyclocheilus rhinocerous]|uniref:piggyBac transposable element-derived protein 4-like isoform X2 n=1 Tax=Sinocyclocheilus rhinocerous TaxID=307959 RepID=UPI0007B8F17A|nr:PREDICTED: piggyBac transposable element-derived protein 4-like isoform X2 [Sinocyclocheilus rhinocerous]
MDETAKDNTEEFVNGIKEEKDEAIILPPALTKKKIDETAKDNSEECGIKGEQDEAIILRPALKKKKRDETAKDNTEECVNGNMEKQDENDEVIDLVGSSDESAASSVDSTEEEMFLDGLDPLLDRLSDTSDDDWYPEATPQKKKRRSSLSSVSPSPAKSCRSGSPTSVQSGKSRGRRSSMSRSLPFPSSILEQKWKSADEPDVEPTQPTFRPKNTPGPQLVSTATCSPMQYFELFFSKSVLQTVVEHTNAYGAMRRGGMKTPWENISIKDLKSFIALVIYMGMLKCFKLTDYWKRSDLYSLPYPARIMSGRKFFSMCAGLHLSGPKVDAENDKKRGTPEYDRLCKIKPLYQDIRDACRASFHPSQNISIDERMVASKARNGLKQYMKNKPTKWGYKLFVLADSLCAYTWDFFIYEGKVNSEKSKGISYDSVMSLTNEKLLGSGYKLFVDNFYTSPKLFRDLLSKKIWACGTIRANRFGHSKTRAPRGNIRWFREDNLLFVEWKDKRDVLMCSTFHKAFNGDSIKRNVKGADGVWAFQDFPVPAAVLDYNKHMGGVNLSDALIGYYTVLHKTKKWYRSFFYHFVDIAVVNAFILHQQMAKMKNQKPMTQKDFREALVAELAGTGPASASAQERQVPATDSHLPKYIKGDSTFGRRKCKLCSSKTPVMCATCRVHLCFVPKRDCYSKWHELADESDAE